MRIGALLAAGGLAVVVALVVVLADSEPRSAGSNYVPESQPVVDLKGKGQYCEGGVVPDDAAGLRVLVGTFGRPTPPLSVEVRADDGNVTSGRLPAGRPQGRVVIPFDPLPETTVATVCLRTGGGRTVLYGSGERLRLEWVRAGSESWWALLPAVADRFGLGKANPFGSALLWIAALLVVLAWGVALRLLLRELRT